MEGIRQSERIQTSVLNGIEKKALVSMASKMPDWVSSDMLTWIGFLGAVVAALGYALSDKSLAWLWLAYLGIILNWFGDSLDGTLARVRKQQRPVYGFYLDHNMDGITLTIVCIGVGMSNMVHFSIAMLVLAVYLLLSIYSYINIDLKGKHQLTFGKMGPTEFRVIVILITMVYHFFPGVHGYSKLTTFLGKPIVWGMFDYFAIGVLSILTVIYLVTLVKDGIEFSKADPLPERKKD